MKKEHLILIAIAVVVAYFLFKKKNILQPVDTISVGDKSNEVFGLQYALSTMTGDQFSNMGAYDTATLNAVQYYMEGTNALKDYEKGSVDKQFAADLYFIQSKVKS